MKCDLCNRRKHDTVASVIVGHLICWLCYVAALEMNEYKKH